MSLKIYCQSCATPTEYSLVKPKFCTECGASFELKAPVKSNAAQRRLSISQPKPPIEEPDEYQDPIEIDESVFEVEEIDKISNKNKGIKFEQLAKSQKTGFNRPIPKKVNTKQVLAEFQVGAKPKSRAQIEQETILDVEKE